MCAERDASYIVMHHTSCKCRGRECEHVRARRRKPREGWSERADGGEGESEEGEVRGKKR